MSSGLWHAPAYMLRAPRKQRVPSLLEPFTKDCGAWSESIFTNHRWIFVSKYASMSLNDASRLAPTCAQEAFQNGAHSGIDLQWGGGGSPTKGPLCHLRRIPCHSSRRHPLQSRLLQIQHSGDLCTPQALQALEQSSFRFRVNGLGFRFRFQFPSIAVALMPSCCLW